MDVLGLFACLAEHPDVVSRRHFLHNAIELANVVGQLEAFEELPVTLSQEQRMEFSSLRLLVSIVLPSRRPSFSGL